MRKRAIAFVAAVVFAAVGSTILAARRPLVAVVLIRNNDFGIPGVTKTYEARITNRSFFPVRVTRCDSITDAGSRQTSLAYAVQRWSADQRRWVLVAQDDKRGFCKPYPLGIIEGDVVRKWLWPGESLSTEEEATAARDFTIGDRGRFIIFLGEAGNYSSSVTTRAFTIDEHPPPTGVALRIRH